MAPRIKIRGGRDEEEDRRGGLRKGKKVVEEEIGGTFVDKSSPKPLQKTLIGHSPCEHGE